jgi:hypothetical protein
VKRVKDANNNQRDQTRKIISRHDVPEACSNCRARLAREAQGKPGCGCTRFVSRGKEKKKRLRAVEVQPGSPRLLAFLYFAIRALISFNAGAPLDSPNASQANEQGSVLA